MASPPVSPIPPPLLLQNPKNDQASYEKMLKLRRDLSRAVPTLGVIKRREKSKRELLHLTLEIVEKRSVLAPPLTPPLPLVPPLDDAGLEQVLCNYGSIRHGVHQMRF